MTAVAETPEQQALPTSAKLAREGITTGTQFANVFSALIGDLAIGKVTPQVGNAMCNAGGKLLKIVELQMKYGTNGPGQKKVLQLADRTGVEEIVADSGAEGLDRDP